MTSVEMPSDAPSGGISDKREEVEIAQRPSLDIMGDTECRKVFWFTSFFILWLVCLYQFPSDDGLRHLGLAFDGSRDWAEVYPYSLFEKVGSYDPWFGYDFVLQGLAAMFHLLPISPLAQQFLLTKILCCIFPFSLLYLVLMRSGILDQLTDRSTLWLGFGILFVFMFEPVGRFLLLRPFAFGSLVVIYAIGQRGFFKGFLSAAILTFLYPYLAWLYLVPIALAHFLKGDRKFALGVISIVVIAVSLQPAAFWTLQVALFDAASIRNAVGYEINELDMPFNDVSFYLFLVGFLVMYPSFGATLKRWSTGNLLILFFLLPALKYERYFIDLIIPLLFVVYGREILKVLRGPFRSWVWSWASLLQAGFERLRFRPILARGRSRFRLKPYLIAFGILYSVLLVFLNYQVFLYFKSFQADLSQVPVDSLVLSDFDSQFKLLYVRPDLRIIPSCEIGFVNDSIEAEYIAFFTEGDVCSLARKTHAQYLLEGKGVSLHPESASCLKLMSRITEARVWKIEGATLVDREP